MRYGWQFAVSIGLIGFAPMTGHARQAPSTAITVPDYSSRILTPPAPDKPRINGPSVYGQRPGSPFLYAVPVTGIRPMTFAAKGLPEGLMLDTSTGIISGVATKAGEYNVRVTARNERGKQDRTIRIVIGEKIALTPPLGWNSWNSWAGAIDQEKVRRAAKILVSSGLVHHGWSYVNIDDTWQGRRTAPDHALLANEKFPDMKGLCDELHGMGLKAGIYSTPWIASYERYPGGSSDNPEGTWTKELADNKNHRIGSYHFATVDTRQWASWGFDYLKYDWFPNDVASTTEIQQALRNSGRDMILSLSNSAPFDRASDWARLSNAWRTTGDIVDSWGESRSDWQQGMGKIAFSQDRWAPFTGPGHWNDPDMLVVGVVSLAQPMHYTHLTPDEQYTHISMWSLLSAPMLIGCDLGKLDPFTLSLLTNDEVLAVDQDALGKGAFKVSGPAFVPPKYGTPPADNPGGNELVYAKELEDGTYAVGLFNVGPTERNITVKFADLKKGARQPVRDLWRQKDMGNFRDSYSVAVPSHGVVLVKIGSPRR
ncbi:MAG: putative Ig domain-containing protein [Fibrella sp.]|nr:putative Ig domain-containing protein [Armatimonadota bacterium]